MLNQRSHETVSEPSQKNLLLVLNQRYAELHLGDKYSGYPGYSRLAGVKLAHRLTPPHRSDCCELDDKLKDINQGCQKEPVHRLFLHAGT